MMIKKTILLLAAAATLHSTVLAQDSPKISPELTEVWEPEPPIVTPGVASITPPSDAIILFDGKDLSAWQKPQFGGEPMDAKGIRERIAQLDSNFKHEDAPWIVDKGDMVVKPGTGAIETKQKFGSFQLHLEWLAPVDEGKTSQGYSNSGVFLMSLYEVQILNSYENRTYSNGQASSIYKQKVPLVNASRPPGEWQSYDIIFNAPTFNADGIVTSPARVTVFHNGVLVQNNVTLDGPTVFIGRPSYIAHPDKMPIRLQDHGNPVRFRNMWIREL